MTSRGGAVAIGPIRNQFVAYHQLDGFFVPADPQPYRSRGIGVAARVGERLLDDPVGRDIESGVEGTRGSGRLFIGDRGGLSGTLFDSHCRRTRTSGRDLWIKRWGVRIPLVAPVFHLVKAVFSCCAVAPPVSVDRPAFHENFTHCPLLSSGYMHWPRPSFGLCSHVTAAAVGAKPRMNCAPGCPRTGWSTTRLIYQLRSPPTGEQRGRWLRHGRIAGPGVHTSTVQRRPWGGQTGDSPQRQREGSAPRCCGRFHQLGVDPLW